MREVSKGGDFEAIFGLGRTVSEISWILYFGAGVSLACGPGGREPPGQRVIIILKINNIASEHSQPRTWTFSIPTP